MTNLREADIAQEAETVLKELGLWKLPVDPLEIVAKEEIELAPGLYSSGFDGRIRYISEIDTFVLAYRIAGVGRTEGRVHFTIGHELGHYYLHRDYLLGGGCHSSVTNFCSKETMEQEADEFAASLLMPLELFRGAVRDYRFRVCTLKELCQLADTKLQTSVTSTVRRYCQADIEPCAAMFSENGRVSWACCSEDMRRLRMGFIRFGSAIPRESKTAGLWTEMQAGNRLDPVEGPIDPSVWYDNTYYQKPLWEEAMPLGGTGIVLTYLTLQDPLE